MLKAEKATIEVTDTLQDLWRHCDELRIEGEKFEKTDFDRHCAAIDARHPIEEQIMTFPTRSLGDVIILAKLALYQMTEDPTVELPWDDFIKHLVSAVLNLEG